MAARNGAPEGLRREGYECGGFLDHEVLGTSQRARLNLSRDDSCPISTRYAIGYRRHVAPPLVPGVVARPGSPPGAPGVFFLTLFMTEKLTPGLGSSGCPRIFVGHPARRDASSPHESSGSHGFPVSMSGASDASSVGNYRTSLFDRLSRLRVRHDPLTTLAPASCPRTILQGTRRVFRCLGSSRTHRRQCAAGPAQNRETPFRGRCHIGTSSHVRRVANPDG